MVAMTTTIVTPDLTATQRVDALPLLDHRARSLAVAGADAPPGRYLVVAEGEDDTCLIALDLPLMRLGRSYTSDIRFDDHTVSRRHAIVVKRGTKTFILDDRSVNGTFVNGRRVDDAELRDGDVIVLGSVVVAYRDV